ncbi:hypothetical protein Desor_1322 [Desulfosporosinus orientis DSM 765]|uniref:Uncharacterized protein n=1 Tax=Desulfosporosinus orientis (strain ATCC 19365 / DSM 765 / NCIMB 8382 / VKM B-1628 / Singapore I) TaxID=768706 RepID=G7W5P6_DESOD|nr:DUF5320 domain-containing protein [Desulfosporosinus orientis]AET66984.1 hypothetical protein Desor_1322 [Desulfosporosinus orientis DSM 765]
MPRKEVGPIGGVSIDKGLGLGTGYKRGPVRSLAKELISPKTQKELLQEQIKILQKKLEDIDQQLKNI